MDSQQTPPQHITDRAALLFERANREFLELQTKVSTATAERAQAGRYMANAVVYGFSELRRIGGRLLDTSNWLREAQQSAVNYREMERQSALHWQAHREAGEIEKAKAAIENQKHWREAAQRQDQEVQRAAATIIAVYEGEFRIAADTIKEFLPHIEK